MSQLGVIYVHKVRFLWVIDVDTLSFVCEHYIYDYIYE